MPRDYKKSSRKKQSCNCRNWLFSGIIFGAAISAFICYQWQRPADSNTVTGSKGEKNQRSIPKPRFDFYTLLPESEVDITDDVEPQSAPDKKPVVTPVKRKEPKTVKAVAKKPATKQIHYKLQLGSFTRAADAEKFKAQLAFQGIATKIQKVKINKQNYYRVLIGPIKTQGAMERTRAKLKKQHIDSMVIKLKTS